MASPSESWIPEQHDPETGRWTALTTRPVTAVRALSYVRDMRECGERARARNAETGAVL